MLGCGPNSNDGGDEEGGGRRPGFWQTLLGSGGPGRGEEQTAAQAQEAPVAMEVDQAEPLAGATWQEHQYQCEACIAQQQRLPAQCCMPHQQQSKQYYMQLRLQRGMPCGLRRCAGPSTVRSASPFQAYATSVNAASDASGRNAAPGSTGAAAAAADSAAAAGDSVTYTEGKGDEGAADADSAAATAPEAPPTETLQAALSARQLSRGASLQLRAMLPPRVRVFAWGRNDYGQLGLPPTSAVPAPQEVCMCVLLSVADIAVYGTS